MTQPAAPLLAKELRQRARELGFDPVGIAAVPGGPRLALRSAALERWLAAGHQAQMGWMADPRRRAVESLLPGVQSLLAVALPHHVAAVPAAGALRVARYGWGRDYHRLIDGRLRQLGRWLEQRQPGCRWRVCVDSAPLMDKAWAEEAGLGWIGKHGNLIHRRRGSWLLLGHLLTTVALPADQPAPSLCGGCRACLDACPTAAFPAPYQLDARRCVSYLTIEHKGPVDPALRPGLGNRIYGCDDCLAVCPWNKFAQAGREQKLAARADRVEPPLAELAALDDAAFRERFARSPIKRTGRDRLVRNVLYAIGNSGDPALVPAARARLEDASPLVRGAAVWALGRLLPRAEVLALAQGHADAEADPGVRAEWASVQSA